MAQTSRSRVLVTATAVVAVMVGLAVVAAMNGRDSDDAAAPDADREEHVDDEPSGTQPPDPTTPPPTVAPTTTAVGSPDPAEDEGQPSEIVVPLVRTHDGLVELVEPDGTRTELYEIPATAGPAHLLADGSIIVDEPFDLISGPVTRYWPDGRVDVIVDDGWVEGVVAGGETEVAWLAEWYGDNGDLISVDLTTTTRETLSSSAFYLSDNTYAVSMANGVVAYVATSTDFSPAILFTDMNLDHLALLSSPTDGRYGPTYGWDGHHRCPGTPRPIPVERFRGLALSPDGSQLVWLHESEADGETRWEIRVLDLATGDDGAIPIEAPEADHVVAVHLGHTLVINRLDLVDDLWTYRTPVVIDLANPAHDISQLELPGFYRPPVTADLGPAPSLPTTPVSPPRCEEPHLSIYGFGDIAVGEPLDPGFDFVGGRSWTTQCDRRTGFWPSDSIEFHPGTTEPVVGAVSIRSDDWSTPSGLRVGSSADEVIELLGDQIEEATHHAVNAGSVLPALDFVPQTPQDAHLRLRFVIDDGVVVEMRAGEREVVEGCLTA